MRGGRPSGTEVVDRQEASSTAKERVKAVLETIAGQCRVEEVCQRLQISEQRFRQLREELLAGMLGAAEPGKPGRRPKIATDLGRDLEEQNRALREQLAAKDIELRAAQARAEIALTLPRVVQESATEKKTPARPRQRGRPPGKRKNT